MKHTNIDSGPILVGKSCLTKISIHEAPFSLKKKISFIIMVPKKSFTLQIIKWSSPNVRGLATFHKPLKQVFLCGFD